MFQRKTTVLLIPIIICTTLSYFMFSIHINNLIKIVLLGLINVILLTLGITITDFLKKRYLIQAQNNPSLLDKISKSSSIYNLIESKKKTDNKLLNIVKRFKIYARQSQNIGEKLSDNTDNSLIKVKEIVSALDIVKTETDNLDSNITSVNNSIGSIFSDFNILNNQISNQNLSLARSSSAIEEMSASTESVLKITKEKNLATSKLLELTNIGGEKLRVTDKIIEDISEQTDAMLQMITMIDDVASRTNLLAINASIEAAHAGESGKGFAVVANEIRKLAENTSVNANKISETLNQITSKIIEAKDASSKSGDTFDQILEKTKDVSNGLVEVATNMEELSLGEKLILDSTSELLDSSGQIDELSSSIKERIGSIEEKMSQVKEISNKNNQEIYNIHNYSVNLNKIFLQGTTYLNQTLLNSENINRELKEFKDIKVDESKEVALGISWNNSLSVNNDKIDNQHRGLIESINSFLKAMVDGTGESEISQMLNKLGNYVVEHFSDEEAYLKQINFQDLEEHKKIHKNFIDKLENLKSVFAKEGSSAILASTIQKEVAQWLLEHIGKEDMKYSK